jgi:hypothetical protein
MPESYYAFIKGDMVQTMAVFDSPSDELLEHFCKIYDVDKIIPGTKFA